MFVGFDLGQTLITKVSFTLSVMATVFAGPALGGAFGIGAPAGMVIAGVLCSVILDIGFHVLASTGVTAAQVLTGTSSDDDDDDSPPPPDTGAAA